MRTSAGTRGALPGSCWKRKRSRPPRAWTSGATGPTASCASPTREAWTTWRKRLDGLRGLRLPRLRPERVEARLFREYLGGVLRGRLVERAGVHLQRGLGVAEAALVLAQDL